MISPKQFLTDLCKDFVAHPGNRPELIAGYTVTLEAMLAEQAKRPGHDMLEDVVDHVVANLNSLEITHLAGDLPDNSEQAAEDFCRRFDLGVWFWEALTLNGKDIRSLLSKIAQERMEDEADDALDRRLQERDLQI